MKKIDIAIKSKLLKIFLDITALGGTGYFIYVFYRYIKSQNDITIKICIILSMLLLGFSSLIYMIINLRRILSSLLSDNPFTWTNVKRIKGISKSAFVISICYFINILLNNQIKKIKLVTIDKFGIHTDFDFLIFFIAACFIYILGKVFEKAVIYKEENDLTI